jgi:hypothetical protein
MGMREIESAYALRGSGVTREMEKWGKMGGG